MLIKGELMIIIINICFSMRCLQKGQESLQRQLSLLSLSRNSNHICSPNSDCEFTIERMITMSMDDAQITTNCATEHAKFSF